MLAQRFARTAVTIVGGPKESLAHCFVGVFTRSRYSDKNGTSRSTPTPEKGAPTPCTKERQRAERPSLRHGLAVHVWLWLSVRANCSVRRMPAHAFLCSCSSFRTKWTCVVWMLCELASPCARVGSQRRRSCVLCVCSLLSPLATAGFGQNRFIRNDHQKGRHLNQKFRKSLFRLFLFACPGVKLVAKHFCPCLFNEHNAGCRQEAPWARTATLASMSRQGQCLFPLCRSMHLTFVFTLFQHVCWSSWPWFTCQHSQQPGTASTNLPLPPPLLSSLL
jgi:hypothetical protein